MSETTQTIKYDPEARGFTPEIFPSREEIVTACERVTADHLLFDHRNMWAQARNVTDGTIVTTENDPLFLQSRLDVQAKQLTGNDRERDVPVSVKKVFDAIPSGSDVNVLLDSTTQWSMYFDLKRLYPSLTIHAMHTAPTEAYAQSMNTMIQTAQPDLVGDFVYKSDWSNSDQDIAISDYASIYRGKSELMQFAADIATTGAHTAIYSNVMRNTDENGASQWRGQRTRDPSGGIVVMRSFARGELTSAMKNVGYKGLDIPEQEHTQLSAKQYSVIREQAPVWDHYTFTR